MHLEASPFFNSRFSILDLKSDSRTGLSGPEKASSLSLSLHTHTHTPPNPRQHRSQHAEPTPALAAHDRTRLGGATPFASRRAREASPQLAQRRRPGAADLGSAAGSGPGGYVMGDLDCHLARLAVLRLDLPNIAVLPDAARRRGLAAVPGVQGIVRWWCSSCWHHLASAHHQTDANPPTQTTWTRTPLSTHAHGHRRTSRTDVAPALKDAPARGRPR